MAAQDGGPTYDAIVDNYKAKEAEYVVPATTFIGKFLDQLDAERRVAARPRFGRPLEAYTLPASAKGILTGLRQEHPCIDGGRGKKKM
jgi:hypothetical protein